MKKYFFIYVFIFLFPVQVFSLEKLSICKSVFEEDNKSQNLTNPNVAKSVWKIRHSKRTGSGFFISPNRFVTALHTIRGAFSQQYTFEKEGLYINDESNQRRIGIKEVVALSVEQDLVILKTKESVSDYLQVRESELDLNESLFVLGYPDERGIRTLRNISPLRKDQARLYFNVDSVKLKGFSGGAVVDSQGRLVAVANYVRSNNLQAISLREFLQDNEKNLCQKDPEECLKDSLKLLYEKAQGGDSLAQERLGTIYRLGRFFPKNEEQAQKWLRLSAEQGNPYAQYDVIVPYETRDEKRLLKKSAEQGFLISEFELGKLLLPKRPRRFKKFILALSESLKQDKILKGYQRKKPIVLLFNTIKSGSVLAEHHMGLFLKEIGELDEAVYWFEKAGEKDHVISMYELGKTLKELGQFEKAKTWFERAALQGDLDSTYELGKLLKEMGQFEKAKAWLVKSALQNHLESIYELGMIFLAENELEKAESWFKRGTMGNHSGAMYGLGMVFKAKGILEKAKNWLRSAASQDHVESIYELGMILKAEGQLEEAKDWFLQANIRNHPKSKAELEKIPLNIKLQLIRE